MILRFDLPLMTGLRRVVWSLFRHRPTTFLFDTVVQPRVYSIAFFASSFA